MPLLALLPGLVLLGDRFLLGVVADLDEPGPRGDTLGSRDHGAVPAVLPPVPHSEPSSQNPQSYLTVYLTNRLTSRITQPNWASTMNASMFCWNR